MRSVYIKIAIALVVGFLVAGSSTHITYSCPLSGDAGCVSFDKVVMHLGDLFSNKQNSLVRFSGTFVIAALVTFALFMAYSWYEQRRELSS